MLNNPIIAASGFLINNNTTTGQSINGRDLKLLTVQSGNASGDALYIIQFDITLRNSRFLPITAALGAAAFGETNVITDNYKPPDNKKQRIEEGEKAEELANKKRKVKMAKDLQMPPLDSH